MNPESLARASRPDVSGTRGVPSDIGSAPGGAQAASGGGEDVTEDSPAGSGANGAHTAREGAGVPRADLRAAVGTLRAAGATVFPCKAFDPRKPDARWKFPLGLPKGEDLGISRSGAGYWFSREIAERAARLDAGRTGLPGMVPGTLAGGFVAIDVDTDSAEDLAAALAILRAELGEPWRLVPTHRAHRRHAWYRVLAGEDPPAFGQPFWRYGETRCAAGYVCLHGAAALVLAETLASDPEAGALVSVEQFVAFVAAHPKADAANGAQGTLVHREGAEVPPQGSPGANGAHAPPDGAEGASRARVPTHDGDPRVTEALEAIAAAPDGEWHNTLVSRTMLLANLHVLADTAMQARVRQAATPREEKDEREVEQAIDSALAKAPPCAPRRRGGNGAAPPGEDAAELPPESGKDAVESPPEYRFEAPHIALELGPSWRKHSRHTVGMGWFRRARQGRLWDRDPNGIAVRNALRGTCYGPRATIRAKSGTGTTSIAKELADECNAPPELWDAGEVIGLPSGDVFDLASGERRGARVDEFVSQRVAVDPAEGEPTLWLTVLREAVAGLREPEAVMAWLRWWCRHTLEHNCDPEIALFVFGPPESGKSTIADTWTDATGSYSMRVSGERFAPRGFPGHSQWIAMLAGRRLVRVPELPDGARWDVATLNCLISGEVVEANLMHHNSINFLSTAKIWITGNHRPVAPPGSGLWRRLRVMQCLVPHEHRDETIRRRLRGESARILGWGLSAPREQPECPRELIDACESYRHEVAPSLEWFTEYVQADRRPDAFVTGGDLRASYAAWCQAADEPQMLPAAFNLAMREAFPHSERVRRRVDRGDGGEARPWVWTGVRLVPLSDGGG